MNKKKLKGLKMFWFASKRVKKYIDILEKQLSIQNIIIINKENNVELITKMYELQIVVNKELIAINQSLINKIKDLESGKSTDATENQ